MDKASKSVIKSTAKRLMRINSQTTTLDVKMDLRDQGYMANQKDISIEMYDIGNEEGWDINDAGTHRVYTQMDSGVSSHNNNSVPHSIQSSQIGLHTGASQVYVKSTNGMKIPTKTNPVNGDWEAYSPNSTAKYYFDSTFSRDDARLAFSSFTGLNFNDTRACKV